MAMLNQLLCVPWNFEIFYDRLGPILRHDITTVTPKDFRYQFEVFGGMMLSTTKQIAI